MIGKPRLISDRNADRREKQRGKKTPKQNINLQTSPNVNSAVLSAYKTLSIIFQTFSGLSMIRKIGNPFMAIRKKYRSKQEQVIKTIHSLTENLSTTNISQCLYPKEIKLLVPYRNISRWFGRPL